MVLSPATRCWSGTSGDQISAEEMPPPNTRASNRLLRLPDWVAFPGHFEGPCGKGMCGRPSTTIGFERLFNPLARLERVPFIDHLTEAVPARPLNITAIEATNRGLADRPWAMLASNPAVDEISLEELESRDPGAILLDVREPVEYAAGHVPGAVNLPTSRPRRSPRRAAARSPRAADLPGGYRSLRAAQFLKQMGFEQVASVAGGTAAWAEAGKPLGRGEVDDQATRVIETEWPTRAAARA